ncbi:MAG: hypothetical protein Q9227_008449 [Pyrenula ochraceoflavens]
MTANPAKGQDPISLLDETVTLARKAPLSPTNFRVGALIYSPISSNIYTTGYTGELPGNTHAEENCLSKLATQHSVANAADALGAGREFTLYTSLEPCGKRLSGKKSCVERIIETRSHGGGIRKVVFGAREPGTFVKDSKACEMMTEAGIEWEFVRELQGEILKVAREGHVKAAREDATRQPTDLNSLTAEERRQQEETQRNPKKRMMEVEPPQT